MSSGQQIIKALAIVFAIFLIVNIFSWAIFGISTIFGISMLGNNNKNEEKTTEFSRVYQTNIDSIKIDTAITKLTLKTGSELKVEGSNLPTKFSSKVVGSTLTVKEEGSKNLLQNNVNSELIITVPENKKLNKLEINTGVGSNTIENITAENFELDCGVGVMQIENLTILSKTKISGGAGRTRIQNSKLEKLDLDAGVGEMVISADITGSSKIECGVGRIELNLLRKQEEYTIVTETGIGRMTLNEKSCSKNQTYGTGKNKIKIEGGVGNVQITTLENEV